MKRLCIKERRALEKNGGGRQDRSSNKSIMRFFANETGRADETGRRSRRSGKRKEDWGGFVIKAEK